MLTVTVNVTIREWRASWTRNHGRLSRVWQLEFSQFSLMSACESSSCRPIAASDSRFSVRSGDFLWSSRSSLCFSTAPGDDRRGETFVKHQTGEGDGRSSLAYLYKTRSQEWQRCTLYHLVGSVQSCSGVRLIFGSFGRLGGNFFY